MAEYNTSSRFRNWAIAVLFIISCLLLYGIEITHGLPNRDVVWIDGNPLFPLIELKRSVLDGWNTGFYSHYPAFHRFLLCIPMLPYMAIQYAQGNLDGLTTDGGYPYGVDDFDTIFMHLAIISRATAILMALGVCYFVSLIGRSLFPERQSIFGALIIAFSPATVVYVHSDSLDVPMLFWFSIALYCYVRVLQTFQLRYYIGLALGAAVSTATKDYAYGAFVLMPIPLVWYLARSWQGPRTFGQLFRAVINRHHAIALGVFLLAFLFAENIIWNPSGFVNHVRLAGGFEEGQAYNVEFGRFDLVSLERFRQIRWTMPLVLGWIGLPICIAGAILIAARNSRAFVWLLWPLIGYYVFTIVPALPTWMILDRPYLPVGLILAICGGQLLSVLWESRKAPALARSVCTLAICGLFANGAAMTASLANDTRYQFEEWLVNNVMENETVELYAYRFQGPRHAATRRVRFVNDRSSPAEADLEMTPEFISPEQIRRRAPKFIVVSERFAESFAPERQALKLRVNPGRTTHETSDMFAAENGFFRLLDAEKLGYQRVMRLDPTFGDLLGMPAHRGYIPSLIVYQRQPATHPTRST